MKPPDKTVTLINLDGSLVFPADMQHEDYMRGSVLFALNSEQGWYTIEFSAGFSRQVIGLEDNTKISEGRDNVIFLNDQLTFIRNGMWETLAIYQATLGRFWEVPSYSFCHEGYSYELPVFNSDKRVRLIGKMLTSGKIVHQPTLSDFIQHYPDVFSKLTPLEGTANQ